MRVTGALDGYSRVTELEAWGPEGAAGGATVNWLVADHLGTPRMVVDQSGALSGVRRHDYLPFGEEVGAGVGGRTTAQGYNGADSNRQQFAGSERDSETGLDFMQSRYYASAQGRFTSVDPYDINLERQSITDAREANAAFNQYLSNPQHWNRYAYVLNNPLKYVDPDGLAERLVAGLNIVYDRNQFTEEEAKKATAAQVADLKKVYGPLDIEFNISYTAGTANAARTKITEGARDGSINVFFSQDKSTHHNNAYNSSNGQIFLTVGANQASHPIGDDALSHEVGHKLGVVWSTGLAVPDFVPYFGGLDAGNLYSDVQINGANARLRSGRAKEGVNWVDDYRKMPPKDSIAIIRGGAQFRRRYYSPTTFDIYRGGARRLAGK